MTPWSLETVSVPWPLDSIGLIKVVSLMFVVMSTNCSITMIYTKQSSRQAICISVIVVFVRKLSKPSFHHTAGSGFFCNSNSSFNFFVRFILL